MISNWKNPLVSMIYTKIFQRFKWICYFVCIWLLFSCRYCCMLNSCMLFLAAADELMLNMSAVVAKKKHRGIELTKILKSRSNAIIMITSCLLGDILTLSLLNTTIVVSICFISLLNHCHWHWNECLYVKICKCLASVNLSDLILKIF